MARLHPECCPPAWLSNGAETGLEGGERRWGRGPEWGSSQWHFFPSLTTVPLIGCSRPHLSQAASGWGPEGRPHAACRRRPAMGLASPDGHQVLDNASWEEGQRLCSRSEGLRMWFQLILREREPLAGEVLMEEENHKCFTNVQLELRPQACPWGKLPLWASESRKGEAVSCMFPWKSSSP